MSTPATPGHQRQRVNWHSLRQSAEIHLLPFLLQGLGVTHVNWHLHRGLSKDLLPQSLALGREGSEASSGRGTPGSWRLLSRLQAGVPTVPGPSQSHAREVQNSPLVPSGKARRPFYKWEAEAQKKKALTKVIQPLTRVELCQAKNTVLRTGLKTTEPYAGPQHDIRPLMYMIPFNLTHTTSERSS